MLILCAGHRSSAFANAGGTSTWRTADRPTPPSKRRRRLGDGISEGPQPLNRCISPARSVRLSAWDPDNPEPNPLPAKGKPTRVDTWEPILSWYLMLGGDGYPFQGIAAAAVALVCALAPADKFSDSRESASARREGSEARHGVSESRCSSERLAVPLKLREAAREVSHERGRPDDGRQLRPMEGLCLRSAGS